MKGQNHLGIYLSEEAATVLCLRADARQPKILGLFTVSVEFDTPEPIGQLADLIAQGCAERNLKFDSVGVALDCRMFMQHNIHSEFKDAKQIAATIRFDAEESLTTDISDVALAFKIIATDPTGTRLIVFTAKKKLLSRIIGSLQSASLDPVTIEPDINSLSAVISEKVIAADALNAATLFGAISEKNGYFLIFSKDGKQLAIRTFLADAGRDSEQFLISQLPLTLALADTEQPVTSLKIFDAHDSLDYHQLTDTFDIEADVLDLLEAINAKSDDLPEHTDIVAIAIAYGAALTSSEKVQAINFRNDYMPYLGKKMRLEKTVKIAALALTILFIAIGVHFQLKLIEQNKPTNLLREKFAKEYSSVMMGQPLPKKNLPAAKLKTEIRRIKNVKSGMLSVTGEQSIAAKLTAVFAAFNNCASQTKLQIDKVVITTKNISITGSTSGRKSTLKLLDAIKKQNLNVLDCRYDQKASRDVFNLKVAPKK